MCALYLDMRPEYDDSAVAGDVPRSEKSLAQANARPQKTMMWCNQCGSVQLQNRVEKSTAGRAFALWKCTRCGREHG
jgi:transposase-like protein